MDHCKIICKIYKYWSTAKYKEKLWIVAKANPCVVKEQLVVLVLQSTTSYALLKLCLCFHENYIARSK